MIPQFSPWAERPPKKECNLVDEKNTSSKYYVVLDVPTNWLESKYDTISMCTLICCFNMK